MRTDVHMGQLMNHDVLYLAIATELKRMILINP